MTSRDQPGSEPLELHVDACQPRKQFYGATCRRAFPWKMEGEEGQGRRAARRDGRFRQDWATVGMHGEMYYVCTSM